MKIAILFPEPLPLKKARGISVVQTAQALSQHTEVHLFTGNANCQASQLERHYGIPHFQPNIHGISRSCTYFFFRFNSNLIYSHRLHKALQSFSPDIIYVRHLKPALHLLKNPIKSAKVIFECHEIFHQTTEATNKTAVILEQERLVYEKAHGLVFINACLQKVINDTFSATSPQQTVAYLSGQIPLQNSSSKKSFSSTNRDIYYIGNFFPWKGAHILIEAMQQLPHYHLHLIGGDEEKRSQELRSLAQQFDIQNQITFYGHQSESFVKNTLLNQAQIVVVPNTPSPYAQFTSPLKLFEAFTANTTLVASDLPSIRELTHHGQAAFLSPAGDAKTLAQTILLANENQEEAAKKRSFAQSIAHQYTWEHRAKVLCDFFRSFSPAVQGKRG